MIMKSQIKKSDKKFKKTTSTCRTPSRIVQGRDNLIM